MCVKIVAKHFFATHKRAQAWLREGGYTQIAPNVDGLIWRKGTNLWARVHLNVDDALDDENSRCQVVIRDVQ